MDIQLRKVIEITNNIDNFIPFGTLFVSNFPGFPAPGLPCDANGWKWLDFPYVEVDGLSPLIKGLRLLVRKAYCRSTYKIFDQFPGIMVVRIYLLPSDSGYAESMQYYRKHYFRFKRPVYWLEKECLKILENLLPLIDFSKKAFNINSANDLVRYIKSTKIALLNALIIGDKNESLENTNPDILNFHIKRMANGSAIEYKDDDAVNSKTSMVSRLHNIYTNIHSPKTDIHKISQDDDQLKIHDMIINNEIVGFKSELYNFQKRSVLKMFERESLQEYQLMPNIVEVGKPPTGLDKYYFDIRTLLPVLQPPLYLPPRGGVLAENMGLGKTCICLALICVSKFQIAEIPDLYRGVKSRNNKTHINSLFNICVDFINQNSIPWKEYYDDFPSHIAKSLESTMGYFEKQEIKSGRKRPTRSSSLINCDSISNYRKLYLSSTTLIVLPDNLFHQWRVEIFKHVKKGYLKVLEISTLKQGSEMLKFSNLTDLLKNDIILLSNSVFSRQFEVPDSVLKNVYWKRLIIDEGHSMNSKTSRAVLLTKDLMYERMWAISGTPTSGMTNLHIENESQEYSVQRQFDPKQDLIKFGLMVSNFFKVEPWSLNTKMWMEYIVKPFEKNEFNIDLELSKLMEQFIVKHTIKDVESDIKLPTLHHKPVFLKPSFFDKLSINLFISVLATNAVTSGRTGVDYMFDVSNKGDLRRLVTNLQKGTFYWTGFSINDVENLLNICVYSLRENGSKYSSNDKNLLKNAIFISKLALSNMRWRSVTTVHEMGYFVSGLPKPIVENYSLVGYNRQISVYGYPHLISIQKFYYKNRTIKSIEELTGQILKQSSDFWKSYWNNIKGTKKKNKSSTNRPLSNKEEYKEFELSDIQVISQTPTWVDTFNPRVEEASLYWDHKNGKKVDSKSSLVERLDETNIGSSMRNAMIKGTLSSKLNYLTMKLLENQLRGIKSIVFYEFENSAYYLTEFLDLLGMNYLMYSPYIKVSDRSNNLAQFDRWEPSKNEGEGICLVMDLKLASHGLTIIAATHVFFINPVWNQSVEAQAIKRSHRIGQMNEVFVETLILENTLEEEMYNMRNDVKDSDRVELIDHGKIKEYILQFPFLKMYVDDMFDGEYSKLNIPTKVTSDLGKVDDDSDDNGVELRHCFGRYNLETKRREWELPLFTKQNLDKLALSEKNKGIKRRFDDIEDLEHDVEIAKAEKRLIQRNGHFIDENTSKLLDKLRSKRKQKVRFKL